MRTKKTIAVALVQENYRHQFTGLLVVDPKTNDTLFHHNAKKYFTPASNVKIATLYTGLKLLPKKIPTLRYAVHNDTLFMEPTGDPSWLHPHFKDSTAIRFLHGHDPIVIDLGKFQEQKYGPGWAWEDYDTYFSPERSPLPLYGNVVSIIPSDPIAVQPPHFEHNIVLQRKLYRREANSNRFYHGKNAQDTVQIPFITSTKLTITLLERVLDKKIIVANHPHPSPKKVLYGVSTDSLYKRMLHESDNFIAEQLMLVASSMVSDTISFKKAKDFMYNNHLRNLKQQPRWVDGSGLSRYNLFTPESLVQLLHHIYDEVPENRLFGLFPVWNAQPTLKAAEKVRSNPFIYAKSGSLGNNYNLSGFLRCRSGKVLIFSFMNNHFRQYPSSIRRNIQTVLREIHENH
ncbi:MAG: D-alanyl-D-alanine carboxypeptidase [Bacteroidota bacterium]